MLSHNPHFCLFWSVDFNLAVSIRTMPFEENRAVNASDYSVSRLDFICLEQQCQTNRTID